MNKYLTLKKNIPPVSILFICLILSNSDWLPAQTRVQSNIVNLDIGNAYSVLSKANTNARSKTYWDVPKPDGNTIRMEVSATQIMAEEFLQLRTDFRSYRVNGIDDKSEMGRIVLTPFGLHGLIRTREGLVKIDALDPMNPLSHRVEYFHANSPIPCNTKSNTDFLDVPYLMPVVSQMISSGTQLRTYDLAIVCTYQFYVANGSSISLAESRVMNTISDLNVIYEQELSVRFTGLPPVVKTTVDDMIDGSLGSGRPEIAAAIVANEFDMQNYDIGHVFHNDDIDNEFEGGGEAQLNSVCSEILMDNSAAEKGAGWSGSAENSSFGWISLVAHEIGHQFGMNHSFSGLGTDCTESLDTFNSFEIGSGSTIMSYRGLCDAAYNIPSNGAQDLYFHHTSLKEALQHIDTISCHGLTNTGNTPPMVNVNTCGGNTTIPLGTPFRLVGAGQDLNGDQIYYSWEQMDTNLTILGLIGNAAANDNSGPLFRSYPPSTDPARVFPKMSLVAAGDYSSFFEALSQVPRSLNFVLTGRDRRAGGGGIHSASLSITVANSGPLEVNYMPGSAVAAGSDVTINWSVNGTNTISNSINIRLSIDGGLTFPYTLANGLDNNGSAMVTIPANVSSTSEGRVMVESADNPCVVFFDISDTDFEITSTCLAYTSSICPSESALFDENDIGLDLELFPIYGNAISIPILFSLNDNSPFGYLASATSMGGMTCQKIHDQEKYDTIFFAVDRTGLYNFSVSDASDLQISFTLFSSGGYDSGPVCAGNFLRSNADGFIQGDVMINWTEDFSFHLDSCTKYQMVVWSWVGNNIDVELNISGPGQIHEYKDAPAAPYQYTFIAVNSITGIVANVSETANFMNLAPGTYQILGASYNGNTVTPGQWLGNTSDQIYGSGDCVLFSSNSKSLTITGDCPASLMLDDTPITAGVYQSSNIISSMGSVAAGTSVTFDAGQTVELNPAFQVESTATFEIKLQGCQ